MIPNIPPKLFSGSAVVVGYLLIDDLTANEQNALGNWLMLTAQVLCTNAFYKQVQSERNLGGMSTDDTIYMLKKMVEVLNKEIDDIKNLKTWDTPKKKNLVYLSFLGSLLIAISGFIFLYISIVDENLDIELAFN